MTISLQYAKITVNDPDESLAFYLDALGLEDFERLSAAFFAEAEAKFAEQAHAVQESLAV